MKKLVKIYENYYEIYNMRLESMHCSNCCNTKYVDIFIDGVVYRPCGTSSLSNSNGSSDCVMYNNSLSNSNEIDKVKYKRYKFWGPLSAYYIMCKQFMRNELVDDEHIIKDFVFKCQYGNDRFDHKILSEKDTQIVDVKFRKELDSIWYIT
jgi:hypothetical protein